MLGYSPFYNETIKKATIAFGSLFSDIKIIRQTNDKKQVINVPIVYAAADAAIIRKYEDPEMAHSVAITLPKMSYYMSNISYDSNRVVNSTNVVITENGAVTSAPAPYLLNFDLYIATANIEDGYQIVEQILPFFKPDFTVTSEMFPELGLEKDLTFTLGSVDYDDPMSSDVNFSDHRIIIWTFKFTVPVWFMITADEMLGLEDYPPGRGGRIIKQTDMRMFLWDYEDYFYNHSFGPRVIPLSALQTDEDYHVHNEYGIKHYLIETGVGIDTDLSEVSTSIIGHDLGIYKYQYQDSGFSDKDYLEHMDNYLKDLIVKLRILPKGKPPTATYDYKTLTLTLGIPKEAAPVKGKDYFTKTEIEEIQERIALKFKENFIIKYTTENKALPLQGGACIWDIQHNIGSKLLVFNVFDSYGNLVTDYSTEFIDENNIRLTIPSKNNIKSKSLRINIIG